MAEKILPDMIRTTEDDIIKALEEGLRKAQEALYVFIFSDKTRLWLRENEPKALDQAVRAVGMDRETLQALGSKDSRLLVEKMTPDKPLLEDGLDVSAGVPDIGEPGMESVPQGQPDAIGLLYKALAELEPGTQLHTQIGGYLGVF